MSCMGQVSSCLKDTSITEERLWGHHTFTGCLKATKVDDLYVLSGIAPPHIRRCIHSQKEKFKQENDPLHPLFNSEPATKPLRSRHSFLHSTEPLNQSPQSHGLTFGLPVLSLHHTMSSSAQGSLSLQDVANHGLSGCVSIACELVSADAKL